jgi:hypothetical protein
MAVPIEFCTVILEKAQLAVGFPGGLDAFFSFSDMPTYIEDDHLVRVAFMATHEAEAFVERVANSLSQEYSEGFRCAVLARAADPSNVPPWLSVGTIDDTRCAWFARATPGRLIRPPRCFGARFFRVPFSRFIDELRTRGITVERLSLAGGTAEVSFARDRARIEAVLGMDEHDVVFGVMTFPPKTRVLELSSHDQLLLDLESALRRCGWEGAAHAASVVSSD